MNLEPEEADAIFGRPMGIPKTGVFGLYDLIGIDLMADVLKSFIKELPETDEFHKVAEEIVLITNSQKVFSKTFCRLDPRLGTTNDSMLRLEHSNGTSVHNEIQPST